MAGPMRDPLHVFLILSFLTYQFSLFLLLRHIENNIDTYITRVDCWQVLLWSPLSVRVHGYWRHLNHSILFQLIFKTWPVWYTIIVQKYAASDYCGVLRKLHRQG